MNIFQRHVPIRMLAEYVVGELSLLRRVDVESHVAVCARCAGKLSEMERLIAEIRTDTAQDAPSFIIDRAVQSFPSKRSRLPAVADSVRHVLAVLYFDNAGLAPAFGVRSGRLGVRQLIFSADTEEIDLRVEPANRDWIVSGQILGKFPEKGRALLYGTAGTNEASLNELSEFVFMPVQAGMYRLVLKLTKSEIEIEELRVGS